MNAVEFLQSWYRAQANGEWERGRGVTIETLDTPGWMVTIDLAGTGLDGRGMAALQNERSPSDWLLCEVEGNLFRGQGDSQKLLIILEIFQHWASASSTGLAQPPS
jgi:immunity protein 53 of polymorphic toxin system